MVTLTRRTPVDQSVHVGLDFFGARYPAPIMALPPSAKGPSAVATGRTNSRRLTCVRDYVVPRA